MAEHPIDRLCRERGVNKKQVAAATGLSQPFITALTKGSDKCGRDAAIRLHDAWGLSIDELILWPRLPRPRRPAGSDPGPHDLAGIASQEARRAARETARRCDCDGEPLPDLGGAA